MRSHELAAGAGPVFRVASGLGARSTEAWLTLLRHVGLLGLLLAEVWLVRRRFDTDRFAGDGRLATSLLHATRFAAPLGIAVGGAWLLIGARSIWREYELLARSPRAPLGTAAGLAVHLLVFAGFFALTSWTFAGPLAPSLAGALLWALAALAVPASATLAAFPPRASWVSFARLLPSAAAACAIGGAAFGLSRAFLDSGLWFPLASGTTRFARWLIWLVTGEVVVGEHELVLGAGDFQVRITRYCSGYEGIGLTWTFLATYFVWFRRHLRFPQALLLIPAATAAVWLANGVRLAALVLIGSRISPDVALSGFHSYAGWIVFCGLSLTIIHASRRIRWFSREPVVAASADTVNPALVYLGPFLAILAVSLLTGSFSAGFDALYPLRAVAGALLLWTFRREVPCLRFGITRTGVGFGLAAFVIWVALERLGIQASESSTHEGLARLSAPAAGLWLALRALGFVLVAPLAEELAFRGFLARRLVTAQFESVRFDAISPVAWACSSLAFGLLHDQWIAATLAGALFGLAAMRRGRLGDACVAHATTNALCLLFSSTVGPWHAWL